MRFDRSITLAVGPMLSALAQRKKDPVAILMYHAIADEPQQRRQAYFNTAVSPLRFEEHLRILSEPWYRVVALRDILANKGEGNRGSLKVIITFDDAFLSVVENGLPLLQKFGFPSTIYIPTGFIETGRRIIPHRPHMSWNDAAFAAKNGMTLGSHTVNHINLRDLTYGQVRDELDESKETIGRNTGETVADFSCPFSFPQEDRMRVIELRKALAGAGYGTGVTTRIGRINAGDDPFTLRRLPVNDDDDEKLFRAKLEGAYDWLAPLQQAKKRLFSHAIHATTERG